MNTLNFNLNERTKLRKELCSHLTINDEGTAHNREFDLDKKDEVDAFAEVSGITEKIANLDNEIIKQLLEDRTNQDQLRTHLAHWRNRRELFAKPLYPSSLVIHRDDQRRRAQRTALIDRRRRH